MCKKIDLKIVETQHKGLDVGDIYAMINENGNKKIANFLNKNSTLFQNFLDNIEFSNHVRFVLKNT